MADLWMTRAAHAEFPLEFHQEIHRHLPSLYGLGDPAEEPHLELV
jgi:hypothetical protein